MQDINYLIAELVNYGIRTGIVQAPDRIYTANRLLEVLGLDEYIEPEGEIPARDLHLILEDLTAAQGDLTNSEKDLFDTKIMGVLTPPPSVVEDKFNELKKSSKDATDWFYSFCQDTNYIRRDRIARDIKWEADTPYGRMDITINLSKPEKDPRDIEEAGKIWSSSYPKCLLCIENEGYHGTIKHPARQNLRLIPVTLEGEKYYLQYSPYVYYNEHCIVLNRDHVPMTIGKSTFAKLLSFVSEFPHYTIGSNADLPIVGGSILSHDHFQGGSYVFPMARAKVREAFTVGGFEDIECGVLDWPLAVIRLSGPDRNRIAELADRIFRIWKDYDDDDARIISHSGDVPHNTVTPIARINDRKAYELDIVLRNNLTTEEYPLGLFHPHPEYHHIKKENIGLIEVMGLAVLPARLKGELEDLKTAIEEGRNFEDSVHASWAREKILPRLGQKPVEDIILEEVGIAFSEILECCGVFKDTEAFGRFIDKL